MIKLTRTQEIGYRLMTGHKISIDDVAFLRKMHTLKAEAWSLLSEQDIVNTDPRSLTPAQKSWRTSLLKYNYEVTVDKLIKRVGLK